MTPPPQQGTNYADWSVWWCVERVKVITLGFSISVKLSPFIQPSWKAIRNGSTGMAGVTTGLHEKRVHYRMQAQCWNCGFWSNSFRNIELYNSISGLNFFLNLSLVIASPFWNKPSRWKVTSPMARNIDNVAQSSSYWSQWKDSDWVEWELEQIHSSSGDNINIK